MPKTKIGIDQTGKPAPLWYRRFKTAMLLCFLPTFIGFVQTAAMSTDARNWCMIVAAAIPGVLQGIGLILGNGQIYSPSNQVIDKK